MISTQKNLRMDRHVVGNLLHTHKPCLAHHPHQLLWGSKPASPHGEQIEMKVRICLRQPVYALGVGICHWLGQEQSSARRQCVVYFLQ